jgi:hypothetical protein
MGAPLAAMLQCAKKSRNISLDEKFGDTNFLF